jgi:hypothetical protein
VIGTAGIVTDSVATAFMKKFYESFARSRSAADSLWLAKHALLTQHKNPFGLLYTLCGDPALRLVGGPSP